MNNLINELCEACEKENLEIVKKLSNNKNIDINKQNKYGHLAIFKHLLKDARLKINTQGLLFILHAWIEGFAIVDLLIKDTRLDINNKVIVALQLFIYLVNMFV